MGTYAANFINEESTSAPRSLRMRTEPVPKKGELPPGASLASRLMADESTRTRGVSARRAVLALPAAYRTVVTCSSRKVMFAFTPGAVVSTGAAWGADAVARRVQ